MGTSVRILIVDDELHVRTSLAAWFREDGYQVNTAGSGKEALELLAREPAHILLVDIKMPGMDGLELHRAVRELLPEATVIVMTAYAAVETAVQALKDGAYDYIVKPFEPEAISRLVRKASERYRLLAENRELKRKVEAAAPTLVASATGAMKKVFEAALQVAPTDTSVLIRGESGTGKELLAQRIHGLSPRQFGTFVAVNCGALSEGVLESELFGHERGAFTGAVGRRRGKIELADEGTLFLDEIGDIPPKVQVDLLRVLQERTVTRVGANTPVKVNFRLISATHRDLKAEVAAGRFREDLLYRIDVLRIELPPLRERREDIALLGDHFLRRFAAQQNRRIEGITDEAKAALMAYDWPGNVRELQNVIERAVVVCRGSRIETAHIAFAGLATPRDESLAAAEETHIRNVLALHTYNVTHAARALGVDRVTLYNKMSKYQIARP